MNRLLLVLALGAVVVHAVSHGALNPTSNPTSNPAASTQDAPKDAPKESRTLDEWLAEPQDQAKDGAKQTNKEEEWLDRKQRGHSVLDSILFHRRKFTHSRHKYKHWRRIYKALHPKLVAAQADLSAKQQVHRSRQKDSSEASKRLANKQKELETAKKNLQQADTDLSKARSHRDAMQILRANRTAVWKNADTAHKQAEQSKQLNKQSLQAANNKLNEANKKLATLTAAKNAAASLLGTRQQAYKAQQGAVNSAQSELERSQEAVAKAEQAHGEAMTAYKQAKSDLQDAANAHHQANSNVQQAHKHVADAQKDLQTATTSKRQASDTRQKAIRSREDAELSASEAARRVIVAKNVADNAARELRVAQEHEARKRAAYKAAAETERQRREEYQSSLESYNKVSAASQSASNAAASQTKEVARLEAEVDKAAKTVEALNSDRSNVAQRIKEAEKALEEAQRRRSVAQSAVEETREDVKKASQTVADREAKVEAAKAKHKELQAAVSQAKAQVDKAEAARRKAEADASAAQKEKDRMELSTQEAATKVDTHRKLQEHYNNLVLQTGGTTVPVAFKYQNWNVYRVRMSGPMNSKTIRAHCRSLGMLTPCNHIHYADGHCTAITKRSFHLSYPPHSVAQLEMPKDKLEGTFTYCGGANGGRALIMSGGSHRWSTGKESGGDTLCIRPRRRSATKVVTTYNGFKFHKVMVQGRVSPSSMRKACSAAGLVPACDHWAYQDGKCLFVSSGFGNHMSHARHHRNLDQAAVNRGIWYTGVANGGDKGLQSWRGSHRWTGLGDMYEDAMCVEMPDKPDSSKVVFSLNGYDLHKVWVEGPMMRDNIRSACKKIGMKPVCNHISYADGTCIGVMKAGLYFSYPPHSRQRSIPQAATQRTYWYSGNQHNGKTLFTLAGTHAWSLGNEMGGVSWCTKPQAVDSKAVLQWNGFKFHKTRVVGKASPAAIKTACAKLNMLAPCDHPAYQDGGCMVVNKNFAHTHMSHPRHTDFPNKWGDRVVWYTGHANGGDKALQTYRGTHRWTNIGDLDETTLCVERPASPNPSQVQFTLNGLQFFRTRVNGGMKSPAILARCKALGMLPVCDHVSYADGQCIAGVLHSLHFSHPNHVARHRNVPISKLQGVYFYAGAANHQRALQMTGGGHRWATGNEMFGDTYCVRPLRVNPATVVANWRGFKFHKVAIQGPATSVNIKAACDRAKLRTPCNHRAYQDKNCVVVFSGGHMSYNPHHNFPRDAIDRTVWYTGRHKYGLMNWRGTHRWATLGDVSRIAMCVE